MQSSYDVSMPATSPQYAILSLIHIHYSYHQLSLSAPPLHEYKNKLQCPCLHDSTYMLPKCPTPRPHHSCNQSYLSPLLDHVNDVSNLIPAYQVYSQGGPIICLNQLCTWSIQVAWSELINKSGLLLDVEKCNRNSQFDFSLRKIEFPPQ